jgi:hypothetical protein
VSVAAFVRGALALCGGLRGSSRAQSANESRRREAEIMAGLGANSDALVDRLATYEILGDLGARPQPVRIARHAPPGETASLVVVERFEGVLGGGDDTGYVFVRRARRIATLTHPNLTGVREVTVNGDDVLVAGSFLDGEKLSELWRFDREGMPLNVGLRVLVGVLAGLGALHRLCGANQQPMRLVHGEIAPTTILFGIDGAARVLHAIARQAPRVEGEAASLAYGAPEVHVGEPFDERADVFSVGVLLWELLSCQRLRRTAGSAPPAHVPEDAPWARALVDVAAKALDPAPEDRWPTAVDMANQIYAVAGARVASLSTAAAWFNASAGERVRARRARLESASAAESRQPVSFPRSLSKVAGPNPVRRSPPRAATLPLISAADMALPLGAAHADTAPDGSPPSRILPRQPTPPFAPSAGPQGEQASPELEHRGDASGVDGIPAAAQPAPSVPVVVDGPIADSDSSDSSGSGLPETPGASSEPTLAFDAESVDETPLDWAIGTRNPVSLPDVPAPPQSVRPEEPARKTSPKSRARTLFAAASAATIALAVVTSVGVFRRTHATSSRRASSAVEAVAAEPSGASVDRLHFLPMVRLNGHSLREPSKATPKASPATRPLRYPARSAPPHAKR